MPVTRRGLVQLVAMAPAFRALQAARREFWEAKLPAEWSADEKGILLGQSPWARQGIVRFEAAGKGPKGPYKGGAPVDVPGSRPGERLGQSSSVPFGEKPPPPPTTDNGQDIQFHVLARWETAKPVRLAGGPQLPPETDAFYVIRLRGMPLLPPSKNKDADPNPNQAMLEAIQRDSWLERKDKAIPCAHLLTGSGDTATELLLFFARGTDPITVAEKIVTLECRFAPFHLSIKFPLREMMYQGALAL